MILAAAHTRVSLRPEHPGLGAFWHQRVAPYVQMDRVQENQVQAARFFDFFWQRDARRGASYTSGMIRIDMHSLGIDSPCRQSPSKCL